MTKVNCSSESLETLIFVQVSELNEWLAPLDKAPGFVYDTAALEELVKVLKGYSEEAGDLPKGMVTTIRVMRHLGVAPRSASGLDLSESPSELRYPYAQIAFYSADCFTVFITILQVS